MTLTLFNLLKSYHKNPILSGLLIAAGIGLASSILLILLVAMLISWV